ncbi:hypothetical protein SY83_04125 [Paenibacillus swuensis]|uniref:Methyl-accepting transducer domain-containing protein n=1 Tax=Paenibacillus swuensis TaxID=1178515 RepID=A0A172TF03_9BACL|nr:methyl-accepting chemotaxis protein [Paenibacillus swuensis]ANE45621.1 hypothetical protein SY83_04125 [Paenibacillus swuensis]
MFKSKNRLMLQLNFGMLLLLAAVVIIFQGDAHIHDPGAVEVFEQYAWLQAVLFLIPVVCFGAAMHSMMRDQPERVSLWVTLSLTFTSMAMVSGGKGMVELHFSIFMVIALVAYYERVSLIVVMTVLFAVQHLGAFFLLPEFVFGDHAYTFGMVFIHAVFLLLTSGATILQILHKQKATAILESENQAKQYVIRGTLTKLTHSVQQLAGFIANLKHYTAMTVEASSQIAAATEEVAGGAERQLLHSKDSAQAAEELVTGVGRIAGSSSYVSDASGWMVKRAQEGGVRVNQAVQQFGTLRNSMEQAAEAVNGLNARSHEIGQIATLISSIASQTNLLALNAAIEAARAGEGGRGFAVVAGEVRKLAEQTGESAKMITGIIEHLQSAGTRAVETMRASSNEVELGNQAVADAGEIFSAMITSLEDVSSQIMDVSASAEQMSAGAQQVIVSLGEMVRISGTTTQGIMGVASSSQEQQASLESIAGSIAGLTGFTEELSGLVELLEKN